ncbi:MAG TPA: hypothetical protein VJN95_07680 [Gemmatimonadales bacterium]|nr:hypothetical protein [Gemmatimonadales bacterium]
MANSRLPLTVGIAWLAIAVAASASGRLGTLQFPAPQLVLLGLTAALMIAVFRAPPIRDWVASLPLTALVALHLTRLVAGAAFLLWYSRGELPGAFALPTGWGDIAVALLAGVLLLTRSPAEPANRGLYTFWNLFGLADILLVVANAARTGMTDPAGMAPLLHLPLSLLPTWLVPIIIVSHVVIGLRLREGKTDRTDR